MYETTNMYKTINANTWNSIERICRTHIDGSSHLYIRSHCRASATIVVVVAVVAAVVILSFLVLAAHVTALAAHTAGLATHAMVQPTSRSSRLTPRVSRLTPRCSPLHGHSRLTPRCSPLHVVCVNLDAAPIKLNLCMRASLGPLLLKRSS